MWYTIYHKFKSTGQEKLVNEFYRWILKKIQTKRWSLYWVFHADSDEIRDLLFHEYAQDDIDICIDTDPNWGFTKTARKLYDIAVLLTYLFDDYLSWWVLDTSWDWDNDTDKIIQDLFVWYTERDAEVILIYLNKYIETELDPKEYEETNLKDIADMIVEYLENNKLSKEEIEQAREEVYDKTNPDPDDIDLEHIADNIKNWFTSWERRLWRWELSITNTR